jgi:hypothetical protein
MARVLVLGGAAMVIAAAVAATRFAPRFGSPARTCATWATGAGPPSGRTTGTITFLHEVRLEPAFLSGG